MDSANPANKIVLRAIEDCARDPQERDINYLLAIVNGQNRVTGSPNDQYFEAINDAVNNPIQVVNN